MSNSDLLYSLEGVDWKVYEVDSIDYRISGVRLINGQLSFLVNKKIVDKKGRVQESDAFAHNGCVFSVASDSLTISYGELQAKVLMKGEFTNYTPVSESQGIIQYRFGHMDFVDMHTHSVTPFLNKYGNMRSAAMHGDTLIFHASSYGIYFFLFQEDGIEFLKGMPLSDDYRLVPVAGQGIAIVTTDDIQVVAGRISENDLLRIQGDRITSIVSHDEFTLAQSQFKGSAVLIPNKCVGLKVPLTFSNAVDGLIPHSGQPIPVVRDVKGEQRSGKDIERLSLELLGLVFGAFKVGEYEFRYEDYNLDSIHKEGRTIHFFNRLTQYIELSDSTLLLLSSQGADTYCQILRVNLFTGEIVWKRQIESMSLGAGQLSPDKIWIGSVKGLFTLDVNGNFLDTIDIGNVRHVLPIEDGLIVSSYGTGLWFVNSAGDQLQIKYNADQIGTSLSGLYATSNDVLVLLSNRGVFYQNAELVEKLVYEELPLWFISAVKDPYWTLEVNGGLFSSLVEKKDTLWVSTMLGMAGFVIENLEYEFSTESSLIGLNKDAIYQHSENEGIDQSRLYVAYKDEWGWLENLNLNSIEDELDGYLKFQYVSASNALTVSHFSSYNYSLLLVGLTSVLGASGIWALFYWKQRRKINLNRRFQNQSLRLGWQVDTALSKEEFLLNLRLMEHDLIGEMSITKSILQTISDEDQKLQENDLFNLASQSIERTKDNFKSRLNDLNSANTKSESDLSDLIGEVLMEGQTYITMKNIAFQQSSYKNIKISYPSLLANCFRVILGNAIKFSPPNSTIAIRVKQDSYFVRIEVEDRGIGLPMGWNGIIDSMVKRNGYSGEIGTGSALKLALKCAESCSGDLVLKPSPSGKGTLAIVTWPIH